MVCVTKIMVLNPDIISSQLYEQEPEEEWTILSVTFYKEGLQTAWVVYGATTVHRTYCTCVYCVDQYSQRMI